MLTRSRKPEAACEFFLHLVREHRPITEKRILRRVSSDVAGSSGLAGPPPVPSTASGSGRDRGRGLIDSERGGGSRTFFPRNSDYHGGSDSRYRRDRWDSAPYQFTRGGNRGGRGRGGKRGGGYFLVAYLSPATVCIPDIHYVPAYFFYCNVLLSLRKYLAFIP
jgi:hypothetical protein